MNERFVSEGKGGAWRVGGGGRRERRSRIRRPYLAATVCIVRAQRFHNIPRVQWNFIKNILLQKQMGVDSET